jgi:prephenate dehydratase
VPVRTFDAALDSLCDGHVQRAVIPYWNSVIGPVAPARAALASHSSTIELLTDIDVPVRHCLLALPGTTMSDVRFVGSHPAALAQCARLFEAHRQLTPCDAFDTAGAARDLSLFGEPCRAADYEQWHSALQIDTPARLAVIASASAASRYGLIVLREDVQDHPANVTRFVVARARDRRARRPW